MKVEQTRYIRFGCGRKRTQGDDFRVSARMGMIFIREQDFGKIRFN